MSTKRVVVAEEIAPSSLEILRNAGLHVDVVLNKSPEHLVDALKGAHALVVRSETTVNASLISACPDLVVIARAGVGLDNIDVEHATLRGVMVVNAPESNSVSAAELTMGLILAVSRNIPQAHKATSAGAWERSKWQGVELSGKTLGILGLGRIGTLVATRAKAFDMTVVAYDPYVSKDYADKIGVEVASLEDTVMRSDILTIHLPKNKETLNLINKEMFKIAKSSLRIVNVARGGIVNEEDLHNALVSKEIAGAAADVFSKEPMLDSPLYKVDTMVVTPHIGALTQEAQTRAGDAVANMVVLSLKGEYVPYAVNAETSGYNEVLKPYIPVAQTLGHTFASLYREPPSDLKVSIRGEIGAYAPGLLTRSALASALSVWSGSTVSVVNCLPQAHVMNIALSSASSVAPEHRGYVNVITLESKEHTLSITLSDYPHGPYIVSIDGHSVAIPPAEHMLIVKNNDKPGTIGKAASILGNYNINIINMDVSSTPVGNALMFIVTSTKVPHNVLLEIRAIKEVYDVIAS